MSFNMCQSESKKSKISRSLSWLLCFLIGFSALFCLNHHSEDSHCESAREEVVQIENQTQSAHLDGYSSSHLHEEFHESACSACASIAILTQGFSTQKYILKLEALPAFTVPFVAHFSKFPSDSNFVLHLKTFTNPFLAHSLLSKEVTVLNI